MKTPRIVCDRHGIRYERIEPSILGPRWIVFACPKGDEAVSWQKPAKRA